MIEIDRLARAAFPKAAEAYDELIAYALGDPLQYDSEDAIWYAERQHERYVPDSNIHVARERVRAVLLALREPSEAMGMASFDATSHLGDGASTAEEYLVVWQAMIDHILNESDGQ